MSQIKISVPNDDHVALRAMAKALEEIAVARGAPEQTNTLVIQKASDVKVGYSTREPEVDTTSQQVESLSQNVEELLEVAEQPFQGEAVPTTDSTGTPWDERIHSASKALNGDDTWRLRRKPKDMDEGEWGAFVQNVQDELLGQKPDEDSLQPPLYEISPGHIGVMQPEPPVTPAGDDFHVDASVVTEQDVASIPAPPPPPVVAPAVPAPVSDDTNYTFPQVMQFLTERHGRITSAQVGQIIADMGLNSIMDLNTQPEHTGPFIARVKALLGE